jgi:catechol 2,3-dioxygenase-like lactoylglutathione lyase family enzyme
MTGIHHLALRVSDCVASARFYAEAFDLREVRRIEDQGAVRAIWLRAGDAVLMLERSIRGAGSAEGSGHVLIFATADVEASAQRLRHLGIPITDRTTHTLYVEDPDGHRAGVSRFPFVFPRDEEGC